MFASELLDVGIAFGLIVGVWFALVGWKLLPLIHAGDRVARVTPRDEKCLPGPCVALAHRAPPMCGPELEDLVKSTSP